MNTENLTHLLALVALLVSAGRAGGKIASRLNFPQVVGELVTGFILGASGVGRLYPSFLTYVAPAPGPVQIALSSLTKIGILLFLMMAGSEICYSQLRGQARKSLIIGTISFLIPFSLGVGFTWIFRIGSKTDLTTMLFIGTALSVSALPVLARKLIELKVYTTKLASIMIGAAMMDDLAAWTSFAVLSRSEPSQSVGWIVFLQSITKLICLLIIIFVLKQAVDKRWNQKSAGEIKPQDALAFVVACLAFVLFLETQDLLHANFGAFLLGIFFAGTPLFGKQALAAFHTLVNGFFAPLFFTSVGLTVVLQDDLILPMTLLITVVAFVAKLLGGYVGSRVAGIQNLPSQTIAWGLNSRGAMEILLATLALQKGIIERPLFVSLVCMAIITTLCSGWMIQRLSKKQVFSMM